jgi:FkbM family methyltransferase
LNIERLKDIHNLGAAKRKVIGRIKRRAYSASYAQCGEDLMLSFAFAALGITDPSYLDIGANDPVRLSNTYLFYRQGCSGVCVEPNPFLAEAIRKRRPRDTVLNVGIGIESHRKQPLYVMSNSGFSTFLADFAREVQSYGHNEVEQVLSIPIMDINTVIEQHFVSCPHLVSIDTEGLDLSIVGSFDFQRFRPLAFCVETLTYSEQNSERKLHEIIELMTAQGYMVYADTYINTVFIESTAWANRPLRVCASE